MRKIKGSSEYLKNQVLGNLAKAALSLILTIVLVTVEVYAVLFTGQFNTYKLSGLILQFVPLSRSITIFTNTMFTTADGMAKNK